MHHYKKKAQISILLCVFQKWSYLYERIANAQDVQRISLARRSILHGCNSNFLIVSIVLESLFHLIVFSETLAFFGSEIFLQEIMCPRNYQQEKEAQIKKKYIYIYISQFESHLMKETTQRTQICLYCLFLKIQVSKLFYFVRFSVIYYYQINIQYIYTNMH